MNNQPQSFEIVNLKEIVLKFLKYWRWMLFSGAVAVFVALLYVYSTNLQYAVETTVLIRQDNSRELFSEIGILQNFGLETVKKDIEDEMQILSSKNLVANAVRDLDLTVDYFEKSGLRYIDTYPQIPVKLELTDIPKGKPQDVLTLKVSSTGEGWSVKLKYGNDEEEFKVDDINKPIKTIAGTVKLTPAAKIKKNVVYKIVNYPIQTITNSYNSRIKVSTINKKTNAVKLSMVSDNTLKAQALLNKIVELYNLDAVVDKNIIASNTRDFVEQRLEMLKNELLDVEISVETYKKQKGITDFSQQADLFMRTTGEYNKELSKIETQMNLVEYIEKHIKDAENKYSLIPANLGIQDGPLQQLIQSYNGLLLERLRVSRTSNLQNPLISQLEEQIAAVRSSIVSSIASVKDGLVISKNDLKRKENQFTGKIKQIPTQEREYIDIKRQQEIKNDLYVFLLKKREENALTLASTIPSAKTLDMAYVIPEPVAPKKMMILAVALLIGLLIPVGVVFVLDLFNQSIKDKKELLRLTKVPFVGSISLSKNNERIVISEGASTPIAEMFRLIRTNLQFMLNSRSSHVVLITSAGSGEGKSFTAVNLALSFALTNKKVLLLGLDIRKPALAEYLKINDATGITHYLSNEALTKEDICQKSVLHSNMDVILSGPVPPNPTELLMSYRLDELIEEMRESYDYIIVDTAPLGIVSDTYLLNRFADNAIFVCRQNFTPREATELINEVYQKGSLNGMGVVLNAVDKENEYGYGYVNKK